MIHPHLLGPHIRPNLQRSQSSQSTRQLSPPLRITTDPEGNSRSRPHRPHLNTHHIPGRHNHHRGHHRDNLEPQSAIHPSGPSTASLWGEREDALKRVTSVKRSRSQGETPAASVVRVNEAGGRRTSGTMVERGEEREEITREDVERERRRGRGREEELRSSLSSLASLATEITRRLDYTYYNLLEKLGNLQSTIGSFQEISDLTSRLYVDFQKEAKTLEKDTQKQIDDYKGFEAQDTRIEGLEERMRKGREKAEALGKRLEVVRGRVEAWERREGEWQARVRRRLRIMWSVIAFLVLLFVAATIFEYLPRTEKHRRHQLEPFANRTVKVDGEKMADFKVPEDVNDVLQTLMTDASSKGTSSSPLAATETLEDKDPRLRIFDEL